MLMAATVFKLIVIGVTASIIIAMADDWFDNGGFR